MSFKSWSAGLAAQSKVKPVDKPAPEVSPAVQRPPRPGETPAEAVPAGKPQST